MTKTIEALKNVNAAIGQALRWNRETPHNFCTANIPIADCMLVCEGYVRMHDLLTELLDDKPVSNEEMEDFFKRVKAALES